MNERIERDGNGAPVPHDPMSYRNAENPRLPLTITSAWASLAVMDDKLTQTEVKLRRMTAIVEELCREIADWPPSAGRTRLIRVISRRDRAIAERHKLVKKRKV